MSTEERTGVSDEAGGRRDEHQEPGADQALGLHQLSRVECRSRLKGQRVAAAVDGDARDASGSVLSKTCNRDTHSVQRREWRGKWRSCSVPRCAAPPHTRTDVGTWRLPPPYSLSVLLCSCSCSVLLSRHIACPFSASSSVVQAASRAPGPVACFAAHARRRRHGAALPQPDPLLATHTDCSLIESRHVLLFVPQSRLFRYFCVIPIAYKSSSAHLVSRHILAIFHATSVKSGQAAASNDKMPGSSALILILSAVIVVSLAQAAPALEPGSVSLL